MSSYGKLVRDGIPDIIRRNGGTPVLMHLSSAEFRRSLAVKLLEECEELLEANDRVAMLLELADIKEVLAALCREHRVRFALALCHNRTYDPSARARLHAEARAVQSSTRPDIALENFLRRFADTLDCCCFCVQEVERKQLQRRAERGAFERRLYLVRVIEPGLLG